MTGPGGADPGWNSLEHQPVIDALRSEVAAELAGSGARLTGREREERVEAIIRTAMDRHAQRMLVSGAMPLPPPVEDVVARAVRHALTGMGALQPLLDDERVTDILINGPDVWVKRTDGSKQRMPAVAASADALVEMVRDIAARSGGEERRFDRGVPRVSVRLPDGSRLFAVMSLSRRTSIAIRRVTLLNATLDDMATKYGAMDTVLRDLFTAMVLAKRNIVIAGGTNTGKTQFLRAFAKAIPPHERLITIEDTDELGLDEDPDHPDCVALQAREPNVEGEGGVDQAELVRWALRMSPDRVILGEARGGEVVPLLLCMSQGNDGSLTTVHTSSSRQAFTRLQTYAAQSAERLPFDATAPLVAGAVHFVVHLAWSTDGRRVVSSIREVLDHADGIGVPSNEVWRPGPDRRAVPAAALRSDTMDRLVEAGLNPDRLRQAWR